MPYTIGDLTHNGTDCHKQLLPIIQTLATSVGWTVSRTATVGAEDELLLASTGESGLDAINVSFQTLTSTSSDFYNIRVGMFTVYNSANTLETQELYSTKTTYAHNNALRYFIYADKNVIRGLIYFNGFASHFYAGLLDSYSPRSAHSHPYAVIGMTREQHDTRFSSHSVDPDYRPYRGTAQTIHTNQDSASKILTPTGWSNFLSSKYNELASTSNIMHNQIDSFALSALVVCDNNSSTSYPALHIDSPVYGEFSGVYHINSSNVTILNVLQVGGTNVDQTGMDESQAITAILSAGGRAFLLVNSGAQNSSDDFFALEFS